jgi:hypothetical protein
MALHWGAPDDIPVTGDYDGDGKSDFAVWRPSSSTWYIRRNGVPGSYIINAWGKSQEFPRGRHVTIADFANSNCLDVPSWERRIPHAFNPHPLSGQVWRSVLSGRNPGTLLKIHLGRTPLEQPSAQKCLYCRIAISIPVDSVLLENSLDVGQGARL